MRRLLWESGFWTLASLLLFGVGCLFHFVLIPTFAPAVEREYDNRALFRPLVGWPRTYLALHPIVYGVLFAAAFRLVGGVEGATTWPQGLRAGACFGLAVFLVGALPVYLLNYASLAMPPAVIVSWITQGVCQYVAAGVGLGLYSALCP
jgi:hypothetical protein